MRSRPVNEESTRAVESPEPSSSTDISRAFDADPRALYQFHPWASIVATNSLVGIPFYAAAISLFGTGRIPHPPRNRRVPFSLRLRRLLEDLD